MLAHHTPRSKLRAKALTLLATSMLVLTSVPLFVAASNHNTSVTAIIAEPGPDSTFTRLDEISFLDGSTKAGNCNINAWSWSFGDDSSSTLRHPAKTYSDLGTYTVTLSIGSSCGKTDSTSLTVSIANLAPVADLVAADGVAGETIAFDASGSTDADGSITSYVFTVDGIEQEAQTSPLLDLVWFAPGTHDVSVIVIDNDGAASDAASVTIDIEAGPLASIVVSGPASLVAGTSAPYGLEGFDGHGNAVTLAAETIDYLAPIAAGPAFVNYTEQGVTGSRAITVLPDALATITVAGASQVVAGTSATYALTGADKHGNTVSLLETQVLFEAPTTTGEATVTYEEQGVEGSKTVLVIADALQTITIDGPSTVAAGSVTRYALAGYDQYENDVVLAQDFLDFEAPTTVGTTLVCYEEAGVEECVAVDVVPAALASITVSPDGDILSVGQPLAFTAAGFDAYGNRIDGLVFEWSATLGSVSEDGFFTPESAGLATVTATVGDVSGFVEIDVFDVLGVAIDMTERFTFVEGLSGAIGGLVTVRLADGSTAAANAAVSVVVTQVTLLGDLRSMTIEGETDEEGNFAFSVPAGFGALGEYRVDVEAAWLANQGAASTAYLVGA